MQDQTGDVMKQLRLLAGVFFCKLKYECYSSIIDETFLIVLMDHLHW